MGFQNLKKPKKSLGQNFFVNANLAIAIVEKVLENNPKKVIEIGPGRGFFTKIFLEKGVEVIAIEKDDSLSQNISFLYPEVDVLNEDIFSQNILELIQKTEKTVCFGSLPYNISKKIISLFATNSDIKNCYFIVQKEVAEKYLGKKKTSILSLATQLYFDIEIVLHIVPENFKPKPSVMSSFVKFSRNENVLLVKDPQGFLNYLHRAFKQPRKTLKNNLQKYFNLEGTKTDLLTKRAEDLNFDKHVNLWVDLVV
jgi:16S rRNA (adenine1518-N6/adenine1519-N6)-dimethyltransferase